MERIGFGLRFGAVLIDWIITALLSVAIMLIGVLSGLVFVNCTGVAEEVLAGQLTGFATAAFAVLAVIMVLYQLSEIFVAGTPGKLFLGLRICNENGEAASIGQLTARWALKNFAGICQLSASILGVWFLSVIGSIGGLILFFGLFLIFTFEHQTLYDKIACTAVYRGAPQTSRAAQCVDLQLPYRPRSRAADELLWK